MNFFANNSILQHFNSLNFSFTHFLAFMNHQCGKAEVHFTTTNFMTFWNDFVENTIFLFAAYRQTCFPCRTVVKFNLLLFLKLKWRNRAENWPENIKNEMQTCFSCRHFFISITFKTTNVQQQTSFWIGSIGNHQFDCKSVS